MSKRNIGQEIIAGLQEIRNVAKKKRKHQHKRIWLRPNDPDTMSFAAYTMYEYGEDKMSITIADCNRRINLGIYNKADRRKIGKLIQFLQEAVDIYDREQE